MDTVLDKLRKIAENYSIKYDLNDNAKEKVKKLYKKYSLLKNKGFIIDAFSSACAISLADLSKKDIDPNLDKAFQTLYPDKDWSIFEGLSEGEITGHLSNIKGKYFELILADKLNSGEMIGEIFLEDGQIAQIAKDSTQPGWDLEITNDDGSIAEVIQAKATEYIDYVNKALEKYPDIEIISTSDFFETSDKISDMITNSDISSEDLETAIKEPLEAIGERADFSDIFPIIPFVIISISEGRKVMMGKKTLENALSDAGSRAIKTGTSLSFSHLVSSIIGSSSLFITLPISFLVNCGFKNFELKKRSLEQIDRYICRLY